MANLVLRISSGASIQEIKNAISFNGKTTKDCLRAIADLRNINCEVQVLNDDAARASGTVTVDNANLAADDVLKVADVSFTAKAGGASGLEFNIGASSALSAANLAAAINANAAAELESKVFASSDAAIVTIRALEESSLGNLIALEKTEATPNAFVLSDSRLASGQSDSAASKNIKSL